MAAGFVRRRLRKVTPHVRGPAGYSQRWAHSSGSPSVRWNTTLAHAQERPAKAAQGTPRRRTRCRRHKPGARSSVSQPSRQSAPPCCTGRGWRRAPHRRSPDGGRSARRRHRKAARNDRKRNDLHPRPGPPTGCGGALGSGRTVSRSDRTATVTTAAAARDHARSVVREQWDTATRTAREEDVVDLLLVVSELVSNALRHGDGTAAFEATATPDGVRLAVHDHSDVVPDVVHGCGTLPWRDTDRATAGRSSSAWRVTSSCGDAPAAARRSVCWSRCVAGPSGLTRAERHARPSRPAA